MPDSPNPRPAQEVERFHFYADVPDRNSRVGKSPDGNWVKYGDHQKALQAEVEKREEVEARLAKWEDEENKALGAAVERAEAAESKLSSAVEAVEQEIDLKQAHHDARRQGSKGSIAAAANYHRLGGEARGLRAALQLLRGNGTEQSQSTSGIKSTSAKGTEQGGAVSQFCGTEHHVLCPGCPCACHRDTTDQGGDAVADARRDSGVRVPGRHVARPGLEEESGPETSQGEADGFAGPAYAVVSAGDMQKAIDSEPRFKAMRDALLPYVGPDNWGEGTNEMREANAAIALSKLLPLLQVEEGDGVAVEGDAGPKSSEVEVVGCEVPGDPQNWAYSLPEWLTIYAERLAAGKPICGDLDRKVTEVTLRSGGQTVQRHWRQRDKLAEFDAWLSFRPEFAEVLAAFRSAFGTDTSATDSTQQQLEQSTTGKDEERNGASGEPLKRPGQQQATRSVSSVDADGDVDDTTGKEDCE